MRDEAGGSHLSLNLLQLEHGGAGFHDLQSWVSDYYVGFGVPCGFNGGG